MGLTSDIEKAFLGSMGNPEDKGNIPQMAEDIANAVIDFLTKQTFTITEMKSILEVEEISTTGPIQADVLPNVTTAAGGPVVQGKNGVLIPSQNPTRPPAGLDLKKSGGQGGSMKATGYAYIGRNPIDITETNEYTTKVKLLDENIIGR